MAPRGRRYGWAASRSRAVGSRVGRPRRSSSPPLSVSSTRRSRGIELLEGRRSIWTLPRWAQNQPELGYESTTTRRANDAYADPGRSSTSGSGSHRVRRLLRRRRRPTGRCCRRRRARPAGGSSSARRRGPSTVRFPAPAADRGTVPRMPSTSLSILMPVFNELATVEAAIDDALTAELPVDAPAARDRRRRLDRRHPRAARARRTGPTRSTIVYHDRNHGKGAALQTGLQHATGEWAAILDADLEYRAVRPRPAAAAAARRRRRTSSSGRARGRATPRSASGTCVGNKGVTLATNVIYNCWISDVMTCHKAMSTELFRSLRLRERGFAIEPEIAARVLRAGERIYEVPITYKARVARGGQEAHRARRAARAPDARPLPRRLSRRAPLTASFPTVSTASVATRNPRRRR